MKEVLGLIGFEGIRENFLVFLAFGVIITASSGILFGLNAALPDIIIDIVQEPISIKVFFFFTLFGLSSSSICAFLKGEKILRSKIIEKGSMAISRVGLSAGAAICGLLIGISLVSYLASIIKQNHEWSSISFHFFGLSLVFAFFIAFMLLFHLYLLLPWDENFLVVDGAGALLLTFVNVITLVAKPAIAYVGMGIQASIILLAIIMYKKIKKFRQSRYQRKR